MKSEALFLLASLLGKKFEVVQRKIRESKFNFGFWGIWLDVRTMSHAMLATDIGFDYEMEEKLRLFKGKINNLPTWNQLLEVRIMAQNATIRYVTDDGNLEVYILSKQEGNNSLGILIDKKENTAEFASVNVLELITSPVKFDLEFTGSIPVSRLLENVKPKPNKNPMEEFLK